MSEIDHIFSKPKSSPVLSSSAKKRRKKKSTKPAIPPSPPSSSRKRPPPETVVDNSSGPSKRPKHVNDTNPNPKKSVKIGPVVDPAFKDSRGTSNRRKTEEGWLVYKEDELGIGDEGGDTPLCPFDCKCCF